MLYSKYLKEEREFKEFIEKYGKVPYEDIDSYDLCNEYSEDINLWWDADKFDWGEYSDIICRFCSDTEEQFLIWWDADKFDWNSSDRLCRYCSNYIDKWWNPKLFDWSYSDCLCEFCSDYFDIWWDVKKFNWNDSHFLCIHCSDTKEQFLKWWDADKFNWKHEEYYLYKYCSEYKNIWLRDKYKDIEEF